MLETGHIVWRDWEHFEVVCRLCHRHLVTRQWTGSAGNSWSVQQRVERRQYSQVRLQRATCCEHCGRLLLPAPEVPLAGGMELQSYYRAGRRRFSFVRLVGADLSGCRLRGVRLREANLCGSRLIGADLSRADLRGACCLGSDFRGATLALADLSGSELVCASLQGCDLRGARLVGADLRGAELDWCNLTHVDLRGALLDKTRLRRCRLDGAILPDGQQTG